MQREQYVKEHGKNEVQCQPAAAPALEQLVRADRIFQIRHGFGKFGDLTGWPAVSVPGATEGLPAGVQVVGVTLDERGVLALARRLV